jgi:2-methylcitrate dehydratase PrpD
MKEQIRMDIMASLVKNISKTGFNDLTPESVTAAKKGIVDTVGVMIAGSSIRGCQLLIEAIKEIGGKEESTIAIFGDKVPSCLAALANSAMARAMDIDDVNDAFPLHPDVVIVPTALAMAEGNRGIKGLDLITAVALGQDLMVRMAYATKVNPVISGRFNLFKVFAATGVAGKLMGLNEEQLSNAMGIAYSHLIGDAQSMHEGVMTMYIQEGEAAKSGIEAAIFASHGITGTQNVLQGRKGFFQAFEPDPNLGVLTNELGSTFRGADIAIKPYASCRSSHEAIDLALSMVKEKGIDPNRIDRITVRVSDITYDLTCHPLDQKRRPRDRIEAQFSIPFTVAAALIRGDFFINELSDEIITNEEILRLAARVTPVLDKECQTNLTLGLTVMEIETIDGQRYSERKLFPRGNPKNPMSMEDCLEKVKKCVKFAYQPFPDDQIDRIVSMLSNLEHLEDVQQLIQLLVPHSR